MAENDSYNNQDTSLADIVGDGLSGAKQAKDLMNGEHTAQKIADVIRQKAAQQAAQQAAIATGTGAAGSTAAAGSVGSTAGSAGGAAVGSSAGSAAAAASTTGATAATTAGGAAVGAGGGAAVGAAGGPIGAVVGAIIGVAAGLLKKAAQEDEKETAAAIIALNAAILAPVFIIIFFIFYFIFYAGTLQTKGISGMFAIHHETEFQEDEVNGFGVASPGMDYEEESPKLDDYNHELPLKNAINLFIYGPPGEGGAAQTGGNGGGGDAKKDLTEIGEKLIDVGETVIEEGKEIIVNGIKGIVGKILNIPGIGEVVECVLINSQEKVLLKRSETDSYTMEMTVLMTESKSKTIYGRINNYIYGADTSNIGSSDQLLTIQKNGETYYIGALVDVYATPGEAYKVTLNNGQTFNMIPADVKSLADKPSPKLPNNAVDTSFGHGYDLGNGKVQLNICEFFDSSITSRGTAHSSAKDYSNSPVSEGTYVVSVEKIGDIFK